MPRTIVAAFGYVVLAVCLTWPLARDLRGQLPGDPGGDTGVYVWNIWLVSHELRSGHSPLHTERIFAATGGADLSQHNMTLAPAMVAAPLVAWLGVVATFNVVYIALLALAGLGVYLLACHVTHRPVESWIGGAVTAASPAIIARSTEHLSLMGIGIVPLFALAWLRMLERGTVTSSALAGIAIAVAAYCDPYLAIYCALLAALLLVMHVAQVHTVPRGFFAFGGAHRQILDGLITALALVAFSIVATGGWSADVLGLRIVAHTLYTPILGVTLLVALRLTWWRHPRLEWAPNVRLRELLGAASAAVAACVVVLLPWILALAQRAGSGRMASPSVYWRSSPPGVDLAAFVAPNPLHPLWGSAVLDWLERLHPAGFAEYTPGVSIAAVLTVVLAAVARLPLPRRWLFITLASLACALGPFVHVAGVNTHIPGPWALLRYVPIVEWARSPSRFALVTAVAVGVLCAAALAAWRERLGARRGPAFVAAVALVAGFELWPGSRTLHAVNVPAIIQTIAADPDASATVLELPVGMRDGTSSLGDFNAHTQFFQVWHRKRLIGGYVSRISERRKQAARSMPILWTLLTLSEGGTVDPALRERALGRRETFIQRTGLRYVVIDKTRCSPELRAFADAVFRLEPLASDDRFELFLVSPSLEPVERTRDADSSGVAPPVLR